MTNFSKIMSVRESELLAKICNEMQEDMKLFCFMRVTGDDCISRKTGSVYRLVEINWSIFIIVPIEQG
jgi:hypothetical protein